MESELSGMHLSMVSIKVLIVLAMFACTVVSGVMPKLLLSNSQCHRRWCQSTLTLLRCLSGGVFMSTCLIDIFPEVRKNIDQAVGELFHRWHVHKIDYPFAEFVIGTGFLLVLIAEQTAVYCKEKRLEAYEELVYTAAGDQVELSGDGSQQQEESQEDQVQTFKHWTFRPILLLVALSFHSFFEGLAIGLQKSPHELMSVFLAVIIHKSVMAFSLGLTLAQKPDLRRRHLFLGIVGFAIVSPLGILTGLGLADIKDSLLRDTLSGLLQGISAGTFIYITFLEILSYELRQADRRVLRIVFVVAGFAMICVLRAFTQG